MKYRRIGTWMLIVLLGITAVCPAIGSAAPAPAVSFSAFDPGTCTFTVLVRPDNVDRDAEVLVPVWVQSDQSDLIWYEAENLGDVWVATVRLSEHQWLLGTYNAHAYARSESGLDLLGGASLPVTLPEGTLHVAPADPEQTMFDVELTGVALPEGAPVWFQASSPSGTFRGYPATFGDDGVIRTTIPVIDHKALGDYVVRAMYHVSGQTLATGSFTVEPLSATQVVADETDGHAGTINIVAEAESLERVESMQAAVWHLEDQSDLRWYDMEKAGDRFHLRARVSDFDNAFGDYTTHVYATLRNGITQMVGAAEAFIEPDNYLTASLETDETWKLRLLGTAGDETPRAAVWSAMFGQDDIAWYDMLPEEDGSWALSVDPQDHPGGRTRVAHIYVDDELVANLTFPAAAGTSGPSSMDAEARLQRNAEAVFAKVGTELRDVYDYVASSMNYVNRDSHIVPPTGYTRQQWYAVEGFETLRGNCYSFASMFYECAKRLGYDAQYIEGEIPHIGGRWTGHAFVLMTIDGRQFICDPVFQHSATGGRNFYMQPIEKPTTSYRW